MASEQLDVVIIGAGPVGMALALALTEFGGVRVRLFERRIRENNGTFEWRQLEDGNRRREQVVTIQDDVVACFANLKFAPDFIGERVWLNSRNCAIRDLEDRLLERVKQTPAIELAVGPPPEVWAALSSSSPPSVEALGQYRSWLAGLGAHVVVATDGAGSLTRAVNDDTFQWTTLGSTDPDRLVETDYCLGIGLLDDPAAAQPQSLNACLTLAQNRYLLNSENGKRGYLNIRLTPTEFAELRAANNCRPCSFAAPVELYDMYRPSNRGTGVTPLKVDCPKMRQTINEGLKLFGLTEDHISSIVGIPLTPAYCKQFFHTPNTKSVHPLLAKAGVCDGPAFVVAGDAAISHHFWPGRGLNTGLKAAIALARALFNRSSTKIEGLKPELAKYDRFMQELRERESQGREMCMHLKETELPSWIDEIKDLAPGEAPEPGSRTAEIMDEAMADRAEQDAVFCANVKAWRDFNEARGKPAWPHDPMPDAVIELKVQSGIARQRPLTARIMNASAIENTTSNGTSTGRAGWPVHQMRGTANVSGEVIPAAEQQGNSGVFSSVNVWRDPLHSRQTPASVAGLTPDADRAAPDATRSASRGRRPSRERSKSRGRTVFLMPATPLRANSQSRRLLLVAQPVVMQSSLNPA